MFWYILCAASVWIQKNPLLVTRGRAGWQAGRLAGRQAGRLTGWQAGRLAGSTPPEGRTRPTLQGRIQIFGILMSLVRRVELSTNFVVFWWVSFYLFLVENQFSTTRVEKSSNFIRHFVYKILPVMNCLPSLSTLLSTKILFCNGILMIFYHSTLHFLPFYPFVYKTGRMDYKSLGFRV